MREAVRWLCDRLSTGSTLAAGCGGSRFALPASDNTCGGLLTTFVYVPNEIRSQVETGPGGFKVLLIVIHPTVRYPCSRF